MSEPSDQSIPPCGRKAVHWRRDSVILTRLREVERRHLRRDYHTEIAAALGVDEKTVRNDLKRLNELWLERTAQEQDTLRARAVVELDDLKRRAIAAAEWDQACERAVLFGEVDPDVFLEEEGAGIVAANYVRGTPVVHRDDKGSAQFRGNKAAALNVARQAVMDQAKVLGLIVEKGEQKHSATDEFLQALKEFGGHAAHA